jgi:cytochrome c55X
MCLGAALSLLATGAAAAEFTQADTARLANMVRQDCGSCHGLTLKGGLGKPLLPANLAAYEDEALTDIILHGVPGTAMPGWQPLLSRPEAEWIARSLKDGRIAE